MLIFNAKDSTLLFKLDNGDLMRIKPGEASKQFVPSLFQIQAILGLGDPSEIAIILSSSYEMELLRQLNGAMAYLKSSVQAARDELMNGKVIEEPEVNVNIEAEKLKEQVTDKDKEIKILQDRVKELEAQLSNSPAVELQAKLKTANEELTRANADAADLRDKLDAANAELAEKDKKIEDAQNEAKVISQQLNEANKRISDSVNAENAQINELTSKLRESEARIKEFESAPKEEGVTIDAYNEKVAELDAAKAEIEQLKKDAVTIVDKYNQAKNTLTSVMDKFGITYNGSEFVLANAQA